MRGARTAWLSLITSWLATIAGGSPVGAAEGSSATPQSPDPTLECWRVTTYEELRGRDILDIANGRDGCLWFATSTGVVLYDGFTWRTWSVEDGLEDESVRTVLQRSDGSVLAGTRLGLCQLVDDRWTPMPGLPWDAGWTFDALLEARDGTLWAAVNGGVLRLRDGRCTYYCSAETRKSLDRFADILSFQSVPAEVIPPRSWKGGLGIRLKAAGEGWYATEVAEDSAVAKAGLVAGDQVLSIRKDPNSSKDEAWFLLTCVKANGSPFEIRALRAPQPGQTRHLDIDSIAEAPDGSLFFDGDDGEVYRFDPSTADTTAAWSLVLSGDRETSRSQVLTGHDGTVWEIGDGLERILRVDVDPPISLPAPTKEGATRLVGSSAGPMWAISDGSLFQWAAGEWRALAGTKAGTELVWLHEQAPGSLWLADRRGIVTRVEVGTERIESFASLVFLCRTTEGEEWFYRRNENFLVRAGGLWEARELPASLGRSFIGAIALSSGGLLACGGNGGVDTLVRWRDGEWKPEGAPRLDIVRPRPRLLCEAPSGRLWFGPGYDDEGRVAILSEGDGEWRIVLTPEVEGDGVATVAMADGSVWMGTTSGLFHLVDGVTEGVTLPSASPRTMVDALARDSDDRLWVGTGRGVFRLDGDAWTRVSSSDPDRNRVLDLTCSEDGAIWAATRAGLCRVDGDLLRLVQSWFQTERVYLAASPDGSVWVQESSTLVHFRPETTPPETWFTPTQDPIDHPGAQVLSWSGQDPWQPDLVSELTWSHRVDDGEWSAFSRERWHAFEDLGPGRHIVQVRARDSSCNVDPTPASTRVEIIVPVWRRAWFLLLVTAGLGALLVQTVRMSRRDRRLREARARAEAAEAARERIEAEVNARIEAEEAQRALHLELLRAQKLEAIGQLAGGIAHDFNNILTAIRGNTSLLARLLTRLDSLHDVDAALAVDGIRVATDRAKALVRQLLTVGRRQATRPEVLEPNAVIGEMRTMLERLLEDRVRLELAPGEDAGSILADRSMFEQVIMNLVVNARDAMPDGGRVTIRTGRCELDEQELAPHADCRPGPFLRLVVEDEGVGIPAAAMERIFEPFYTTKPIGKGTGLGLSTVFAVVRQCLGFVTVVSEPGVGSRFEVYWPSATSEAPCEQASEAPAGADGRGAETIFVCEDDPVIRELIDRALKREGFTVLTADSGEDALDLIASREGTPSLLITDLILPGMTGTDLAEAACALRPGLAVLFMSGQVEELLRERDALPEGAELLRKPFAIRTLLDRVRGCLVPA